MDEVKSEWDNQSKEKKQIVFKRHLRFGSVVNFGYKGIQRLRIDWNT